MRRGLLIVLVFFIFSLTPSFNATATSVKSIKKKYRDVKERIKEHAEAIKKAKRRELSILSELEKVSRKLDVTKREIREQRRRITSTRKKIALLKKEIKKLTGRIGLQRRYLIRKIQAIQKYGNSPFVFSNRFSKSASSNTLMESIILLANADNLSQFLRQLRYLKQMAEYEYSLLSDYNDNLRGLEKKEEEMSLLLKKLNEQKRELVRREKVLRKSKHRKRMLLAKVKRERELYKNMISELKASARKLRKMIEEAEKARYALKGFSKMKRRLPWPVEGRLALPYGSYRDPKFKTPVFRNGIHIRAKEGDIVRSVYPGKVVFADWFKGYGKVVIVNHGEGYYTVYANLSEIFLSKGDIINKGDEIGRVGESGTLSAPALYFEVRYKGKPLNPLHWLKRKKG